MKWTTGYSRDVRRALVAVVASSEGVTTVINANRDDMRLEVNEYGSPTHFQLNPAELQHASYADYLVGPLAALPRPPEGAHAVFRASVGGLPLLIPAQALIRALFGAQKQLRDWLFHPAGLSIATERSETFRHPNDFSLKAMVAWLNSSDDMAACWASVYRFALQGKVDLKRPDVLCNFSAWGHDIGGTLHVTHLILYEVQEAEVTRHIRPKNGRCTYDARAARVAANGLLTDEQWRLICTDLVAAFPPIGGRPAFTLRQRFQMILFKRATNIRWNAMGWSPAALASAQRFNSRLNRTELWEKLIARLTEALVMEPPCCTGLLHPPAANDAAVDAARVA